jgi:hypothetical protein
MYFSSYSGDARGREVATLIPGEGAISTRSDSTWDLIGSTVSKRHGKALKRFRSSLTCIILFKFCICTQNNIPILFDVFHVRVEARVESDPPVFFKAVVNRVEGERGSFI